MPETIPTYLIEAFAREQATYDTFVRFDQYDAVSPIKGSLDLEPALKNTDRNEAVGTASYQGSTKSSKSASWKGTFKLKPKNPTNLDTDLHQYNDGSGTVYVRCKDGAVYDDLKTSATLAGFTANYQLLPDADQEASGDGFLVGHAKQFSRIQFNDLQTGNGAYATWSGDGGKYQYSTGEGTWTDLTVTDTTDTTAQDGKRTLQGAGTISFTIPENWVKATYDSQEAYWIRYNITGATLTQTALIDDTNKDEPFVINVDQMGPDIRALIKAAMGWESVTGITSIAYKFSDTNTPPGLQLQKHLEGYLQENVSGGCVNSFTLKCPVNEDPTFEFDGAAARYGRFVKDVIGVGGIATSGATVPLNNASRGCAIEPAVCQVGDDTNTVSLPGYIVTAHDDTEDSGDFTISPVLAGAGESAAEVIKPYAPSRSVEGTILPGVSYTLTIDGVTLGFTDLSVKVTTAYALVDNESTSDRPTGIKISRTRVVDFEVSGYYKTSATGNAPMSGRAFDVPSHDIDLTIGSASGARLKVSIPAGEGQVSKLDFPADDVVMVTIKGRAKQASTAADELVLTLD